MKRKIRYLPMCMVFRMIDVVVVLQEVRRLSGEGSTASPLFVKLCGLLLNLASSVDLGANRMRQKFANIKAARQVHLCG